MSKIDEFTQFLRDQSDVRMKETTIETHLSQLEQMISKYELAVEEVSEENAFRVLKDMEKNLAPSSMNYRRMILESWLKFHGVEPGDRLQMALQLKKAKPQRKLHPGDLLTEEEVLDIVEHTQSTTLRALLMVLWDTGRRPSGITRLNVSDVTSDRHGYVLTFRATKTDDSRRPVRLLSPKAMAYFERWWAMHPRREDSKAPLFINERGNRYNSSTITGWLKEKHEDRLDRGPKGHKARLNMYLFRKSRATALLKEGKLSEIQIKMRLGHKLHSNMLEKYYAIIDEMDQAKAELSYMGIEPEESKSPQPVACPNCGVPNEPDASRCHRCKHPLTEEEVIKEQRQVMQETLQNLRASGELRDLIHEVLQESQKQSPE